MAECIEKAAILSKCEEMWNNADETTQSGIDTINTIDRITDLIEAMPVVDVQPVKRGRWELTNNPSFKKCSECGAWWGRDIIDNIFTNYCPKCGADMRETTKG